MVVFCQYHEGTIRFMPADYLASDNGHWAAEYQCPSQQTLSPEAQMPLY